MIPVWPTGHDREKIPAVAHKWREGPYHGRWPDTAVAAWVIPPGVAVLDIDNTDLVPEARALVAELGGCRHVRRTPRGGAHLYVDDPDRAARNATNEEAGWDWKAHGGYVVAGGDDRPELPGGGCWPGEGATYKQLAERFPPKNPNPNPRPRVGGNAGWAIDPAEFAARLGLTPKGSEYAGPCPVCADGDDRFFAHAGGKGTIATCRQCGDRSGTREWLQQVAAAAGLRRTPPKTRRGLKHDLGLLDRLPPEDDYLRWKTTLIAYAREYGDNPTVRKRLIEWSAGSPRYNPDEFQGHWDAALAAELPAHSEPLTLATVELRANEARSELTPPTPPPPVPTPVELGDITGIDPWGHVTAPFGLDRPPPPAADPIIDGVAHRGEAVIAFGAPKAGKSTLARAICAAAPRALYIAHERAGQSYAALAAAIGHEPGTPRTHLHAHGHLRPADLLIDWAVAAPTVVIIDSFTSSGGDTHTGTNALDWWTEHVTPWTNAGCAVWVLAHKAKTDGDSPLGSTTQEALADAIGQVRPQARGDGGGIHSATWTLKRENGLHYAHTITADYTDGHPRLRPARAPRDNAIRKARAEGATLRHLADQYGISKSQIERICKQ